MTSYAVDYEEFRTGTSYEGIATFDSTNSDGLTKCYVGKSTRPLKKRRPKDEKTIMESEAKKAALIEYFTEHFEITTFDDILRDEFHRPINL